MKLSRRIHPTWVGVLVLALLTGSGCDESSNSTLSRPSLAQCIGQPDSDGDGICDSLENQIGTNPNNPNSDAPVDPFPDGLDFNPTNDGRSLDAAGGVHGWLPIGLLASAGLASWAKNKIKDGINGIGSDDEEGTDTSHPATDAQVMQKLETNTVKGKINFDQSYIQIFVIDERPPSKNVIVSYYDFIAEGRHMIYLAIGEFETGYPYSSVDIGLNPSLHGPAATAGINPRIDLEKVPSSQLAIQAFNAVALEDKNKIAQFNGTFMRTWKVDGTSEYDSIDAEGIGYYKDNFVGSHYLKESESAWMEFPMTELQYPLPPYSLQTYPYNWFWSGDACSLRVSNTSEYHVSRCLMYTYAAGEHSLASAYTWVRRGSRDLQASTLPWAGRWQRAR